MWSHRLIHAINKPVLNLYFRFEFFIRKLDNSLCTSLIIGLKRIVNFKKNFYCGVYEVISLRKWPSSYDWLPRIPPKEAYITYFLLSCRHEKWNEFKVCSLSNHVMLQFISLRSPVVIYAKVYDKIYNSNMTARVHAVIIWFCVDNTILSCRC